MLTDKEIKDKALQLAKGYLSGIAIEENCITMGRWVKRRMKAAQPPKKELSVDVWDWVVTKGGKVVKITHDDMPELPYEEIERKATVEDMAELLREQQGEGAKKRYEKAVSFSISSKGQALKIGDRFEKCLRIAAGLTDKQ